MYKKASKFRSLRGFLGGVFERAKSIKQPKVKRKHSPSKPSIKELQTKTKLKIILCPSCQQNFKSSEINNHFKKVHPKEKFTKCKFCDLIVFSETLVTH